MFKERLRERDSAGDRNRPAGGDAAVADPTGTILRRLLANLGLMAQVYALTATRDARLGLRDMLFAAVLFSAVVVLGFYLTALAVAASVLALSTRLPAWAAALVVLGGIAAVIILMLLVIAWLLRRVVVRIRTAMQAAKEDLRWFRTRILRID